MQSSVNKILLPIFAVGSLAYVFSQTDLETPDPDTAAASFIPVAAPQTDAVEPAAKQNAEPHFLFGEYPCRNDCSEHFAGYKWARENGISEADNCDGLSAAFIEGCRVYVEARESMLAAKQI